MLGDCEHNWEVEGLYSTCLICGTKWNTQRLLNYLQAKYEQLKEGVICG